MGNSSSRDARPGSSLGPPRAGNGRNPSSPTTSGPATAQHDRSSSGGNTSRPGRGNRHDLSFLGIGGSSDRDAALEPRRETRAEREARKLEKERVLRVQERERSLREEGVDGGYLVTLGTYTGPEDFSKPVVRQLMIERRLAPFWKGLEDHKDTWTEHQLVAVVNGLPLPAPDEIPPEEPPHVTNPSPEGQSRSSNMNISHLTVPISSRSPSSASDLSANLSASHPAFSGPSLDSAMAPSAASPPSSSPFFRGRAKTLAALSPSSRTNSQTEMTPQEVQLPKDPYVNGQRIEVFLYKNATECPICFLAYPPYLNKTRCCDQPICSECFVQIKRPDPHPPEHHDPTDPNAPTEQPEDNQLVSEPASCPFCVQPEFGVTYEPPPFRRGLVYANQGGRQPLGHASSAMSSTSSLGSHGLSSPPPSNRRRATSLATTDSHVITTDRVRPDWAKKLADARSHALRRAAAATALHNAAYVVGNLQSSDHRGFALGRRRRTVFGSESPSGSGHATPRRDREADLHTLLSAASGSRSSDANPDLLPGRHSSRRTNRMEDLEELMMMEAIRLSLAAEEERKRKEEKEAAKLAKKEEKKKAKEAKKADKELRRPGFHPLQISEGEEIGSSSAGGKGKAVDRSGGPGGPNGTASPGNASSSKHDSQRHLEHSRAQIQRETDSSSEQPRPQGVLRSASNASSTVSSFGDSDQGSLRGAGGSGFAGSGVSLEPSPNASGLSISRESPQGTPGTEPMFNFRSLAAVIDKESDGNMVEYREDVNQPSEGSAQATPDEEGHAMEESVATVRPASADDRIEQSPPLEVVDASAGAAHDDSKYVGNVSTVPSLEQEATQ